MHENLVRAAPHKLQTRKKSQGVINDMDNVDFLPSNVHSCRQEALLKIFEDNEAVIKMIIKGRSPTMRHISRTHRVALDWLFDRINLEKKLLDLQKRFPKNHACPKCPAACRCGLAVSQHGLASLQDHDKVEVTPVDWERGIVHCELTQYSSKSLESFIQLNSFCSS